MGGGGSTGGGLAFCPLPRLLPLGAAAAASVDAPTSSSIRWSSCCHWGWQQLQQQILLLLQQIKAPSALQPREKAASAAAAATIWGGSSCSSGQNQQHPLPQLLPLGAATAAAADATAAVDAAPASPHFCSYVTKAKMGESLRRRQDPRFRVLSHERTPGPVALCFAAANARTPPLGEFSSGGANSPPADAELSRWKRREENNKKQVSDLFNFLLVEHAHHTG